MLVGLVKLARSLALEYKSQWTVEYVCVKTLAPMDILVKKCVVEEETVN